MLSTAFASAFDGQQRVPDLVGMDALKSLLRKVRKIVEYFHKSAEGLILLGEILFATVEDHGLNPSSKLAQAIHQRWGSLVKSLINFIERFDGLRSAYQGRGKFWDIDMEERTAIVEIISVLSPVRDIIVLAQSNKGALVPSVVAMLTDLRMDTLNPLSPLLILDPVILNLAKRTKAIAALPPAEIGAPDQIEEPPRRDHDDLTDVGRAARVGMNAALSRSNRFFHLYTRNGSCKPDRCLGAFDIITVLHPFMKNLKFMNAINASTPGYDPNTDDEWLDLHKERIKNYYIDLMVKVIVHNDKNVAVVVIAPPAVAVADDAPAAAKRQRGIEARDIQAVGKKRVIAMKSASYMDVDSDGDEDAEAEVPVLTAKQRATTEFAHYMTKKTASALQVSLTSPEGLIHFWQHTGKREFPVLAVVAMAQLGTPPGSGVLENDFSTFANLVTRRRSRLDAGIVEMILFCKLNHNLIPNSVPEISRETINDHVPIRLRDPDMQAELQALDVDPHAHDSESDMDDAEI